MKLNQIVNREWQCECPMGRKYHPDAIYEGKIILLLTPKEINCIGDGFPLINIFGEVKNTPVDMDTRGGFTAFGVLKP